MLKRFVAFSLVLSLLILPPLHVAAQNGVHPDTAVFAEDDVTDKLRGDVHVTGLGNGRGDAFIGTDHSFLLWNGHPCAVRVSSGA